MSVRIKLRIIGSAMVLLIFLITTMASGSSATVVWSENFNKGTINDWTVQIGSFDTSDSTLRVTNGETCEKSSCPIAFIYHNSTLSVGTWTFDIFVVPTERCMISFMRDCCSLQLGESNVAGYSILFDEGRVKLVRHCGNSTIMLSSYVGSENSATWNHVVITRDTRNDLEIFIDGNLRLQTRDSNVCESGFFSWMIDVDLDTDLHSAIDNIIVSDSLPISEEITSEQESVFEDNEDEIIPVAPPVVAGFEALLFCVALPPAIMTTAAWRKAKNKFG